MHYDFSSSSISASTINALNNNSIFESTWVWYSHTAWCIVNSSSFREWAIFSITLTLVSYSLSYPAQIVSIAVWSVMQSHVRNTNWLSVNTFDEPSFKNETIWRLDSFAQFRTSSNIVVMTCNLSQIGFNSSGYSVLSTAFVSPSLNVLIACDLHFSIDLHKAIPRRWAASHLRWFSTSVFAIAFSRWRIPMLSFLMDFMCDGLSLTAENWTKNRQI